MERSTGTKNPLIIAHRGASSAGPENSLASYKLAWMQEADAIEIDLRKTKDGIFICAHDNNFNRVSSSKKNISETTYKTLSEIDIGSWKSKKFKEQRVPKLEEVLSNMPKGKMMFIEVKGVLKKVEDLMALIECSKVNKNQIHFLCYLPSMIKKLKKKFPSYNATLNLIPSLFNYDLKKIKNEISRSQSDGISVHIDSKQSIKLVKNLKEDNIFILTWTVNDKRFMKKLLQIGVNGIITDFPEKLAKLLGKCE